MSGTLCTTVLTRISFQIEVTLACTLSYAFERLFKHRKQSDMQLKIRTSTKQLDQTAVLGAEVSAQHDTYDYGALCFLYAELGLASSLKLQGIAGAVGLDGHSL